MLRQIVFDTETTGFDPEKGDRIVEIGAVEIIDYIPTGRSLDQLINPERPIPEDSTKIHGITDDHVKDKPTWAEFCDEFLNFVGDAELVAHNAGFDMNFINFQLLEANHASIEPSRFLDSLKLAKKKFPASPASLDALCRRFHIDLSVRAERHGALVDSELLAKVWLELNGGHQLNFFSEQKEEKPQNSQETQNFDPQPQIQRTQKEIRIFELNDQEKEAHRSFLDEHMTDPIWKKFL